MITNKLRKKFTFPVDTHISDISLLDILISGWKIVGIKKQFHEDVDGNFHDIEIYLKNNEDEFIILWLTPLSNGKDCDIQVAITIPMEDEAETNQENSWDNISHLTDER